MRSIFHHTRFPVVLLAASVLPTASASAQWTPCTIQRLGLYQSDHISNTGTVYWQLLFLKDNGVAAGYSHRYLGTSTLNGHDAWVWKGGATIQLGFTGGVYRASNGYQNTEVIAHNASGWIVGNSFRVTGGTGADAWLWNSKAILPLGYQGGAYTSPGGKQSSAPKGINSAGQIVGESERYLGETSNGRDGWLWSNGSYTQLGLTGVGFEGSSGYRLTPVLLLNDAGIVAGSSSRISGLNVIEGAHAWVWNGTSYTRIGVTGGANTSTTGRESSAPVFINSAGQVAGYSTRFQGNVGLRGVDAWVWNGTSTVRLGYQGGWYLDLTTNEQNTTIKFQNQSGQICGTSDRYYPVDFSNGKSAWVWKAGQLTQIGLLGSDYFGSDGGFHETEIVSQNQAGQIAGATTRVTHIRDRSGYHAWVWRNGVTLRLGLFDSIYSTPDGVHESIVHAQNQAGFVVGRTKRQVPGANNSYDIWQWDGVQTRVIGLLDLDPQGQRTNEFIAQNASGQVVGFRRRSNVRQDVWLYDPATQVTHTVTHTLGPGQSAFFVASNLTDQGLLSGRYAVSSGSTLGPYTPYLFHPTRGKIDLSDLVAGGLAASGWASLREGELFNQSGVILGNGLQTKQQYRPAYALVPGQCVADFDADGAVALEDIFVFLNDWFSGRPLADINGGGVTLSDVFAFLNAWFNGC